MAKRLTDSEKWEDPWFLDLSDEHKLLWIYILDKCDHAGIWKINKRLAEFCFGRPLKWNGFFDACGNRIQVIDGGEKLFIPKFITFQYGFLDERNTMFKPVTSALQKEGLQMGDLSPINGGKVKEKDKRKVKEEEKEAFGDDGLVLLTREECEKLYKRLGERKTAEYIIRLENYIGSKGKKYKSHYYTILSWAKNEKPTTVSCDNGNPMNLNKTQLSNLEALHDFTKRKGAAGPEDLRPGNGNPVRSLPSG